MTVVLDATAAIAIITCDHRVDAYLTDATRVLAPDLIVAETLNVRRKYSRAGLEPPDVGTLLALFDRITLVSGRPYAPETDAMAKTLDHPAYDCLYATVARMEKGRLLTADRRFARKLRTSGIDVAVFS